MYSTVYIFLPVNFTIFSDPSVMGLDEIVFTVYFKTITKEWDRRRMRDV
jgi:hypothetical protein